MHVLFCSCQVRMLVLPHQVHQVMDRMTSSQVKGRVPLVNNKLPAKRGTQHRQISIRHPVRVNQVFHLVVGNRHNLEGIRLDLVLDQVQACHPVLNRHLLHLSKLLNYRCLIHNICHIFTINQLYLLLFIIHFQSFKNYFFYHV